MRKGCILLFVIIWANISSQVFGEEAWKFIVLCDSRSDSASIENGVNTVIMSELVSEIVSQVADLVLFAGDLVVGGVDQTKLESQFRTWRDTMQPVYEAGIGVYAVRGNHDEGNPAATTAWNNIFKDETASGGLDYSLPVNGPAGEVNLTYSVTHKNAFFLGLDQLETAYRSKNKVNQGWVDAQLASNMQPHIFTFGHYTSFKMIWESLKDAGSHTYFCGHEHFYNHSQADDDGDPSNDLHQYVIGSAGASVHQWDGTFPGNNGGRTVTNLYHTTRFGYVLVEIDGMDVSLTWMERQAENDYQPADYWTYSAGGVLGDFDEDGSVDLEDFAILAGYWVTEDCESSNY